MKRSLLVYCLLLTPWMALTQAQLENPGFEGAWENVSGSEDEPEQWSSLKTADALTTLAPIVAFQETTDPHSGTYCIRLKNISSVVVANGLLTNGRVHADLTPSNGYVFTDTTATDWNYVFTDRPDSMVAWIKYSPQGSDTSKLEIVLHDNSAFGRNPHDGTYSHWIGKARYTTGASYASWTRISVPFSYFSAADPDYCLMVISAGDSTEAVANSELWVDDIELIYNPIDTTGTGTSIHTNDNTVYSVVVHNEFVRVSIDDLQNAEMVLMNLEGKKVYETKLTNYVNELNINVPEGIYIYNIRFGDAIKRGKVKL